MAKKILLPLSFAVIISLSPLFFATKPFTMLVVDGQTGVAVPNLRVTHDGMVQHTGTHGELILWGHSAVQFEIEDERNEFDTVEGTVDVTPGGHATAKVHRRIYR
jgi:hypothetical protein